jgi:NADPH:quinone reductase-like Zn-dependent oxidoreductase
MKAVVMTKFGQLDKLRLQEVAKPVPKDNEVLIRIHTTTVTAVDSELRGLRFHLAYRLAMGMYVRFVLTKPVILRQELVGEIEAVGKHVTRFRQGAQVLGWTGLRLGAYAEYICLPENGVLAIKPPTITYEQAAPSEHRVEASARLRYNLLATTGLR